MNVFFNTKTNATSAKCGEKKNYLESTNLRSMTVDGVVQALHYSKRKSDLDVIIAIFPFFFSKKKKKRNKTKRNLSPPPPAPTSKLSALRLRRDPVEADNSPVL